MWRSLFPVLVLGFLLGCGSGGSEGLRVNPQPAVVRVDEKLNLRVDVLEDLASEPFWEIQEVHGGGLLRSQGLDTTYLAPASAGTYHLILRTQRADGRRLKQVVEVTVLPNLTLEPAQITLSPGASHAFELRAKGLPKGACTWTVEEAEGGTVSPEGVYTAPSTPGTYHLSASPAADPGSGTTATITVR